MATPQPLNRRGFLVWLTGGAALLATARVHAAPQRSSVLIPRSPLAGFQYHHGEALWSMLHEGDPLTLVRETENPHDKRAVRVDWQGLKLGYVPRMENTAVAQMLDQGERLTASIVRLRASTNPWDRIILAVELTSR